MRPGVHLPRALVFADNRGVAGAVGGLAALVGGTSSRLRRLQNGFARAYALTMLAVCGRGEAPRERTGTSVYGNETPFE